MKISNIELRIDGGSTYLEAMLDSEKIWYEVDVELDSVRVGDVLVSACLSSAMVEGKDLILDEKYAVSQKLYNALEEYQTIFDFWYPNMTKVNVIAKIEETGSPLENVGSFFSGGVDSLYTYMCKKTEVTDLVFIHGLDMQLDNDEQFELVYEANKRFADMAGVRLVLVKTNMRFLPTSRGLSWPVHCQGLGLGSVAHLMGFGRMFVPASYTYAELFPCASHPLTDPMLSSERVKVMHHGATRRSQKIEKIAEDNQAVDMLRVCWQDDGYNCGKCEKCVRTMLILRLLGIESKSLPKLDNLDVLKKFRLHDKSEFTFVEDALSLAEKMHKSDDYKYLSSLYKKLKVKQALIELEQALFGGKLKRALLRKG